MQTSLQDSDFDFIANNSMEIAEDIVTFNVFKEKNPDSGPAKKNFRGILPYEYDKKGKPVPNYESITVGQVFYNPEDGLFYERIAEEGVIATDFKHLILSHMTRRLNGFKIRYWNNRRNR
jgi:hypothetical protein